MKYYAINEEQRQALLNSLAVRPYQEVYQIIQLLSNLPEVVEASQATPPEQAVADGEAK